MIIEFIVFIVFVLLIGVSFFFMYKAIINDTGVKKLRMPTIFVISLAAGSVPTLIINIIKAVLLIAI